MPRSLRGNPGSPVSLFSFQDVMMTVMGILLLITLMMALELAEAPEQATATAQPTPATPDQSGDAAERLRTEIERLRERVQEAERRLELVRQFATPAALAAAAEQKVDQVKRLSLRLQSLQQQLEQLEADHGQELTRNRVRLKNLELEADHLKAQLNAPDRNERVTWIRQDDDGRRPLLIDVRPNTIAVAAADAPEVGLELPHDFDALQPLLKEFPPRAHYVVLLVRPSSFDRFHRYRERLSEWGYSVGIELVDEQEQVIATGGGR